MKHFKRTKENAKAVLFFFAPAIWIGGAFFVGGSGGGADNFASFALFVGLPILGFCIYAATWPITAALEDLYDLIEAGQPEAVKAKLEEKKPENQEIIICPHCARKMSIPKTYNKEKGRCHYCNKVFEIDRARVTAPGA